MARRRPRDIPLVHPGEILKEEFLMPLDMSVSAAARAIAVPRTRLNDVVLGRRAITADTAMRLGRYFGVDPRFWMNLQTHYELEVAGEAAAEQVARKVRPRETA